jgi:methionyl-tRNA formyltransferase
VAVAEERTLVFANHDVGFECLNTLLARGVCVIAVFTHEDDPNEHLWFKSVAALAHAHGVPIYTPKNVNTPEWIERIHALQPDLIFSFYYRHIISEAILREAPLGAYNMHGSLLPKYRGRVPINWAVLHGETETGATLHAMVKRPDAGDIVDQERVPISPDETARDVFAKVSVAARHVLERQLDNLLAGTASRRPQDESQATYFSARKPEDGRIDWQQDARTIFNLIRAVTHPYPGAFTEFQGKRFLIWWARPVACAPARPGEVANARPLRIATGDGALEVDEWQWQGDARPSCGDGHGLRAGFVLGALR